MLYSQDYIEEIKISTNMFKTLLLSATTSSAAVIMKQYLSNWVDPLFITLTAMVSFGLILFKFLNEISKYRTNKKKQRDEDEGNK